jgi:hypothetical protein
MASHAGQGLAGGLRQTLRPARELPETPFGQRPDPSLLRGALMALSVAPIPHPGWCAGEKGHKGKGAGVARLLAVGAVRGVDEDEVVERNVTRWECRV